VFWPHQVADTRINVEKGRNQKILMTAAQGAQQQE
jgi:hypothetical protein